MPKGNPSNDELRDLNAELEAAGLPRLGEEDSDSSEDTSPKGANAEAEDVVPAEAEVVPTLSEMDDEGGDEKKDDDEESEDESESDDEDEASDDESEDDDEAEDEDDESGEDDDELESRRSSRRHSIPYSQYRDEKKALQEQVDFWKLAANRNEDNKGKPADDKKADPIEEAAKALAQELNFDESKTKILVSKIVDAAKAQALPKELMDRLDKFEKGEAARLQERVVEAEQNYFQNEWSDFAPTLQKQYPNATPKQIAAAKRAMDIISHAPQFAKIPDLEYIFTKTKKDFDDILFSPKKKTFERGRQGGADIEDSGRSREIPSIGNEDPASMKALEDSLYADEDDGMAYFDEEGERMR